MDSYAPLTSRASSCVTYDFLVSRQRHGVTTPEEHGVLARRVLVGVLGHDVVLPLGQVVDRFMLRAQLQLQVPRADPDGEQLTTALW